MKLILLAVLLAVTEADTKTYLVKTKDHQDHQDYIKGPLLKGPLLPPHRGGETDHCNEDMECRYDEECVNNKCVDLVPIEVPDGGECRKDRQCLDWRSVCHNNKCVNGYCDVDSDCYDNDEECANNKCIDLVPNDIHDGGECRKDRQCLYDYSCVNGKCEQPRNRTCEVQVGSWLGNRLENSIGAGCFYYEECVNNICIQLAPMDVPIGGECRSALQCRHVAEEDDKMDCVNKKCQIYVKKPNGKECDMDSDCVSHHCVNEVCQPKGVCLKRYHCNLNDEECIEGKCTKSDKKLPGQDCAKDEDCFNNQCVDGRCYIEVLKWMV